MAIRYDVVSTAEADNMLMDLWTNAPSAVRKEITRASAEIDKYLKEDAHLKGFIYGDEVPPRRVWVRAPLVVHFEVSEPDRRVRIIGFEMAKKTT